ncbi:unnamed protein product [Microthlaspi erraticum]|uniref:DUF577 domain-containing protein n=1 Tax=Microthlaspi erraticum TaxID=1685480 RepID=A0A6D2L374_9BRAS|nr:unnamed protein product [Microthlaspi erraticum]
MAESPDLTAKATAFLNTRNLEEVAKVLFPLFMDQETSEHQSSLALYEHCVATSPDSLTRKLLNVYLSSPSAIFRFRAIHLLSETISDLRNCNFRFSPPELNLIKPLLISCLWKKESKPSDIKILARIVSFVAHNNGGEWNELSDCILELANTDPRKACLVVLDLPLAYGRFITRFAKPILEKTETMLLGGGERDWSLALQTAIKIAVQVSDSETDVERIVLKPAEETVKKEFLQKGIEDLKKFLARDGIVCRYNDDQRFFVGWLVFKIAVCCYQTIEQSKRVTSEVLRVLKKPRKYEKDVGFASDWWDYLTELSPVDVLRVYALKNIGGESKELAIKRLNFVLFEHTSEKVKIEVQVMRQLQGNLILRLKEEGVSENMFRVLGEVVFHVANEMLSSEEDKWFDLWSYIGSECKTEFKKAVYVFQCLTMWLEDKEFVIPAVDNLLPEITRRLKHPLVDESCWALAFVGAFCAMIHLVEMSDRVETVKEVLCIMVGSVRELVGRRMEVGFVRRGFRDVESVVKKELKWYSASEYRFVKGLLRRLYEIKGMEMESKIVLWRINKIVERGVKDVVKEYPKGWLDWLKKPEA